MKPSRNAAFKKLSCIEVMNNDNEPPVLTLRIVKYSKLKYNLAPLHICCLVDVIGNDRPVPL